MARLLRCRVRQLPNHIAQGLSSPRVNRVYRSVECQPRSGHGADQPDPIRDRRYHTTPRGRIVLFLPYSSAIAEAIMPAMPGRCTMT